MSWQYGLYLLPYTWLYFILFIEKKFLTFIYFWETERQSVRGGGAERERGRHRIWSRLQALSCQQRAQCRARTHRPRDHHLSQSRTLNWATQAPLFNFFLTFIYFWERERAPAGEEQRARETQNEKQAPDSKLWTPSSEQSPTWSLNPRITRSIPELKSDA